MATAALMLPLILSACGEKDPRPNIVLISIDSLRADHLSSYGYGRKTSPRIDQLASKGALFEKAFSTTSWTLPSHMALFTSMYDTVHGVTTHDQALDPLRITLPMALQEGGYNTAGFYSGPYLIPAFGFGRGFDKYIKCFDYMEPGEVDNKHSIGYKPDQHHASHNDVTSPRIHQEVSRWLERTSKNKPFFLFVHMWDVHYDYLPPAEYATRFTDPTYRTTLDLSSFETNPAINDKMDPRDLDHLIGLYDGEIAYTDDHIGKILDKMKSLGLSENTIVLVTSDHGEAFFEHGTKGHQKDLFDEVLHIPLIISWPGKIEEGVRVSSQASIIDIMPTLLDLAGVPSPPEALGRSLKPLIDGTDREMDEALIFSELTMDSVQYRRHLRSIRTPQYKVIYNTTPDSKDFGKGVIFNLKKDPKELRSMGEGAFFATEAVTRLNDMIKKVDELANALPKKGSEDVQLDDSIKDALKQLGYIPQADPPEVKEKPDKE